MQRNFRDKLNIECGDTFLFVIPKDLESIRDKDEVLLARY
jgi:hypothetical protein